MKRTPIRRKPQRDPVTPALYDEVLARDKMCIAALMLGADHECRDSWGTPHDPRETWRLSLEHVKSELAIGKRAPSDAAHVVALCHGSNVAVPSRALRTLLRQYLAGVAT